MSKLLTVRRLKMKLMMYFFKLVFYQLAKQRLGTCLVDVEKCWFENN